MGSSYEEDALYIESILIPEMVDLRLFCEPGSREFIDLESVVVEPGPRYSYDLDYTIYRATVVILFSDEPRTFHVLVKLLPGDDDRKPELDLSYDSFCNEQVIRTEMIAEYGYRYFPKFYSADTVKHSRPAIVVDDLERLGFQRVTDRLLNQKEAALVAELIAGFHGKGVHLKNNQLKVYNDVIEDLKEVTFAQSGSTDTADKIKRLITELTSDCTDLERIKIGELLEGNSQEQCKEVTNKTQDSKFSTFCQGLLVRENLWFDKSTQEVRIQDWKRIRLGSIGIDLATIMLEIEDSEREGFLNSYFEALSKEVPEFSNCELIKSTISSGVGYAITLSNLSILHHDFE